jgi:outer membrane protein insertion porin family
MSQDFAGFGGNTKYIRTEVNGSVHHPLLWDEFVGTLSMDAGYIQGWGGRNVRLQDRFFKGGDTFRGFALAGIGPRELGPLNSNGGANAVGGDAFAVGTADLRLPEFLPADYGISLSLFSDFGTLGHLDSFNLPFGVAESCSLNTNFLHPSVCVKDNLALRVSAGIAIAWKSPFGPVQIDLGMPVVKQSYDKTQIIHFSAGTGL